jgi:hypothetical protein
MLHKSNWIVVGTTNLPLSSRDTGPDWKTKIQFKGLKMNSGNEDIHQIQHCVSFSPSKVDMRTLRLRIRLLRSFVSSNLGENQTMFLASLI